MGRSPCCPNKEGMNRGAWTAQEDELLRNYIKEHGEGKWRNISKLSGLKRCGKSCRLRWLNYLRPDIKRGNISKEEEDLIIRLHKLLGNRWALIAGRLPGRTDNEIKNYWNTSLGKRVKNEEQEKDAKKEIDINVHRRSIKAKKSSLKITNSSNIEKKKIVEARSFESGDVNDDDSDSRAFFDQGNNNLFPNVEANFGMGEFLYSDDVCDAEFWKICDLSFSSEEMLKNWIRDDDCHNNPEAASH